MAAVGLCMVKVSNRSGAGNGHFRDLQTMLERQKRLNFLPGNPKSLLTETTLARPSKKHGALGRYIRKKQQKRKFLARNRTRSI